LTAADFTAVGATIASELPNGDRAIAIPVDSAHGLVGFVHPGDHVDVLASFGGGTTTHGTVTVVAQDVLVLSAPGGGGGGGGIIGGGGGGGGAGNMVLRVDARTAQELAFDADNGKVWITLRPPAGAISSGSQGAG
jgi:Flp pilus assembly protein CpaB